MSVDDFQHGNGNGSCASFFGTTYAVDRALLLGGQALAEAYGKARQTGNPYFWSERNSTTATSWKC